MVKITKEMEQIINEMVNVERYCAGEYHEYLDKKMSVNPSDKECLKAAHARWMSRIS